MAYFVTGGPLMFSALIGAGVGAVASGYASWRVFSGAPSEATATTGAHELGVLYRAEVGKLAVILVLCATVFAVLDTVSPVGLILGLVASMVLCSVAAISWKIPLPDPAHLNKAVSRSHG